MLILLYYHPANQLSDPGNFYFNYNLFTIKTGLLLSF